MLISRLFTLISICTLLVASGAALSGQKNSKLNDLFGYLHVIDDPVTARQIENIIWSIWKHSENQYTNVLMQQGEVALSLGDLDLALRKFNEVVKLEPDFAEGWNKRATVHYLNNNYIESIADVQQTLSLEPRHFGALAGLGMILEALQDKEGAIKAYRSALSIHPLLSGVTIRLENLLKDLGLREL